MNDLNDQRVMTLSRLAGLSCLHLLDFFPQQELRLEATAIQNQICGYAKNYCSKYFISAS
jgi:hypothetical protein